MMSSNQRRHTSHGKPDNTFHISRSKIAGALQRRKLMTVNWYKPLPVLKAVFGLSSSFIATWQYPLQRSKVENQLNSVGASKQSSILGSR